MKIEKFDPPTVKRIAQIAHEAAAAALAEHGLSVAYAGGTYDVDQFTVKLKITPAGADPEKADFERNAWALGLQPGDYGREFRAGGRRYKLVGVNLRRSKFPLSAVDLDTGKRYKLARSMLAALVAP